ncbi:MAG: hypothetical protein MI725_10555, partial [Pirellulales bacterium]|nr:hypothetical protein [Pirellulales bacterium]
PLSQTAGSETERAQKETNALQRQVAGDAKAEKAAGIGETEQDQGASDRDADGRRLWEPGAQEDKKKKPADEAASKLPKPTEDPTGNRGNSLDLTG